MSRTRYYCIKAFTPSERYCEKYIAVVGSDERHCLDQAQKAAANFSNNMADYEYNTLKEDRGYHTFEKYLGECGWSVHPVTKARYKKAMTKEEE